MKKIIATLLALIMLLGALTSCSDVLSGVLGTVDETDSGTVSTIQDAENDRLTELGTRDFGGKVFKVLDANDYPEMHVNYATDKTKNDSNINEELYNRDIQLTNSYNLGGIEYTSVTKAADGISALRVQILADACEYDMVISTVVGSTADGAAGGTLAPSR